MRFLGFIGGLCLAGCRPTGSTAPDAKVWQPGGRDAAAVVMTHATPKTAPEGAVIQVLRSELAENLARLQESDLEEPVYFLSYDLLARQELWIEAEAGVLIHETTDVDRTLDVDVRVGAPELDNTFTRDGNYGPGNGLGSGPPGVGLYVSVEDDPLSLAQALWIDTEAQYRDAVAALRRARSEVQVRSDDGPAHPDFSREDPVTHLEPEAVLEVAELLRTWRDVVLGVSRELAGHASILQSRVILIATVHNRHFVNSEGSTVQDGQTRLRVLLEAQAKADDGMDVSRSESFEAHQPGQLPKREDLLAAAVRMRREVVALRSAAVAEPYTGPAVLDGRAAGVLFHEIFGHRLEGHRQKDDAEGQTFTKMLGKKILPAFLDVVDDPTVVTLGSVPLSGHYLVDDEAVRSQRTVLVDRGKLKTYLLSRSPVLPFVKSNGHGRRERSYQAVARQGNLIVTSRKTLGHEALRRELIAEMKRQGKPYGLWFTDIDGGFTTTDREGPQAFKVIPRLVYKVFADGRPDELVRGLDIVGTPLAAFETIMATGDRPGIFNGSCGAESGWVPVSAVSPALLLRSLEVEHAQHDRQKPPLLAPPRPSPALTIRSGGRGPAGGGP